MSSNDYIAVTPEVALRVIRQEGLLQHALRVLTDRLTHIATSIDEQRTTEDITKHATQVIVALATLQTSVQDLSRAYIKHANTVLAPGRGGSLDANLTNILSESGLLAGANVNAGPAGLLAEAEGDGKKKRKRTPHDPNAPKRALTPYFLYMQSARGQISRELGEQAKPKEVADEGTRRWTEMPPADKAVSLVTLFLI